MQLFELFILSVGLLTAIRHASLTNSDVHSQLVVSLSLLIDNIEELYLVGHESLVDISVQGLFLGQFTSQEVKLSLLIPLH